MRLSPGLGDSQAQSGSFGPRPSGIGSKEATKQVTDMLRRYSLPIVPYDKPHHIITRNLDPHRPAIGAELDGVVDEVSNDATQYSRVRKHHSSLSHCLQGDTALSCKRPIALDGMLGQASEIDFGPMFQKHSRIGAGQHQEILGESR